MDMIPRVTCDRFGHQKPVTAQMNYFIHRIQDGIPCENSAEAGCLFMKTIDAAYRPAEKGCLAEMEK